MVPEVSRRARRRRGKPASRGSWWIRGLVGLMVLGAIVMGGGYLWLKSWIHSDDFRELLSVKVGDALGAKAEFGEFRWDGTVVDCKSVTAAGGRVVGEIDARGLSMDIGLGQLSEQVVLLRDARINQIEAHFDLTGGFGGDSDSSEPKPEPEPVAERAWYERWIPNDFRLTQLDVPHSSVSLGLEGGNITFDDTRWAVIPGQSRGSYEAVGRGGQINFPWPIVPELRLGEATMRYQDSSIFLIGSNFRLYERGYATLTGEASSVGYSFDGSITDVRANEILPEDWRQRVEGGVEADFSVMESRDGPSVSGTLELKNGVLTGLPVLDALGAYGGNPRFRRLALSEASTDFRWEAGATTLTNMKIGSEGLMRVEGRLRVEADDRIDGRFRIGLTPGTLARIPGAETKVFLPGERGLLWTTLHVTGTLDDPKEDLTERLIMAAGMRMFEVLPETGEQVLKFTRRAVDPDVIESLTGEDGLINQGQDLIDAGRNLIDGEGSVIENATEALRKGEDVVRGVEGIFGFFDNDEPETVPDPDPEPDSGGDPAPESDSTPAPREPQ